ncbi:MAG: hypothetical protein KC615_19310 [Anaerolineae bacterium]|nr:hypothetical protein [Anaerolineae bacterium]
MLEIGLLALATLATGGLIALARTHWHQRHFYKPTPRQYGLDDGTLIRKSHATIAHAGVYSFGTPAKGGESRGFAQLRLEYGDLILQDARSKQLLYFPMMAIQWVSAITLEPGDISAITLHIEREGRWHLLALRLPQMEMTVLVRVLRQAIHSARINIGNLSYKPIGPLSAYYAHQSLQGETVLDQPVELYLLPHLLVVLKGDRVQAKLDISSVRRVLAVDRIHGVLDSVLKPNTPEGIVHLYSMSETVSFALAPFRDFADEIGSLSRCPVEHVYREDKASKL